MLVGNLDVALLGTEAESLRSMLILAAPALLNCRVVENEQDARDMRDGFGRCSLAHTILPFPPSVQQLKIILLAEAKKVSNGE